MTDQQPDDRAVDATGPAPTAAGDAELRDAIQSVEAIGEDRGAGTSEGGRSHE